MLLLDRKRKIQYDKVSVFLFKVVCFWSRCQTAQLSRNLGIHTYAHGNISSPGVLRRSMPFMHMRIR